MNQELTRVAWGFLGNSNILGRGMMPAMLHSDCAFAAAVASRDAGKAAKFAKANGIERSYGSYSDLLADDQLEAIYISLPNRLHAEWTVRALEAGKHVLCEKPLTGSYDEAVQMFDAADQNRRILMEAFMYRHHPDTAALAQHVISGEIGVLQHIRATMCFKVSGGVEDNRLRPEMDGGSLMDAGCYAANLIRLLAGEPGRVCGIASNGPTGVDLSFSGFFSFPNGTTAVLECGLNTPSRNFVEVVGSKGSIRANWPFFRPRTVQHDSPNMEVRVGPDRYYAPLAEFDAYLGQINNLSRAIRGLERPLLGRAEALAQARVIDALRWSAASGGVWKDLG